LFTTIPKDNSDRVRTNASLAGKLSLFRNGATKSVGVRRQSGMSAYAPGGFTLPSHCPGAPIFVCDDG